MKKGKTSTRQSEEKGKDKPRKSKIQPGEKGKAEQKGGGKGKGIKVLVPLLSKREAEPAFINLVASKAREVILLLVIDTNAMSGEFGFATNEIAVGNALMQKTKIGLGKKKKTCNDVIEWGNTANKIEHLAMLHMVDKIYVVKQDNHFFKKLLRDMRENLPGIEIEAVKLPGWE